MTKRDDEILGAIQHAEIAVREGCYTRAERLVDKAAKRLRNEKYIEGALTYAESNDACDAFLEEAGFTTLACLLNYIKHWQEKDQKTP
jgi:ribosomal protein S18 acetylase RimI-like enzyme